MNGTCLKMVCLSCFWYAIIPIAVIGYCVVYYVTFWRRTVRWKKCNIPFVRPPFLIGPKEHAILHRNIQTTGMNHIYRTNQNKSVVGFFMAALPGILVRDPELLQQIFVRNYDKNFTTFFNIPTDDIETQAILSFSSDRPQWTIGRTVMAPMFSPSRIEPSFPKFKKQMDRLCHQLEKARLEGRPISVKRFSDNFVYDTEFHWNFGEETNSYEKKPKLHDVYCSFFDFPLKRQFSVIVYMCVPALYSYIVKFFDSFKFVDQRYFDFMRSFLKQKMEDRMMSAVKNDDLIDYFMALRRNRPSNDRNGGDGALKKHKSELFVFSEISLKQMTGYGITLLLASNEPVSQISLGAVHFLSLHPECQDRIKKEIDDVMKKHRVSDFTYDVIQDLHFTKQCLWETTRLIPLLRSIVRICCEDFQIPGTNYQFKKDDIFIAVPYALHRDPKYFKDPDKFDPERFSPENRDSTMSDAFIPFGLGPRKCPGYKVGLLHAVMLVASFVSRYEIRPSSHLRPMTADDFAPMGFINFPKEELIVDLIPRPTSAK